MPKSRRLPEGPLYLLATAVLWSTAGVLTKFIPWSAMTVACMRGLIAAVMQIIVCRVRPFRPTKTVVLTAFCYTIETCMFMFANKMTSAGNAIVLQNTAPLFIILMSLIFLGQKPSKLDVSVGAVIFLGVVLSLSDSLLGGEQPGSAPMAGNIIALASAVFYAAIYFTSRMPGANPLQSTVLGNLMYAVFLPFLLKDDVLMGRQPSPTPPVPAILAVLFLGVFQLGLSWIFFSRGIEKTPALQASFITMVEPVLNPILALIFLGEKMGTLSVIGSVLVISMIVVHNVLTLRSEGKKQTE